MSFMMNAGRKPAREAVLKQKLTPKFYPNAIREKVIWGPFTLQPAKGKHATGGLKLDAQSDVLEENLSGLCTDCMILGALGEVTDKQGKRLDLSSSIYTHHVIAVAQGKNKKMVMPPVNPMSSSCPGGKSSGKGSSGLGGFDPSAMLGMGMSGKGGMGGMSHGDPSPKMSKQASSLMSGHSLSKRQFGGFSMFIGQGNEGDVTLYAPINSTVVKSGVWIAKGDKVSATAELVNYNQDPKEVYFAIDAEYLKMDQEPKDYLPTGTGAIQLMQCGNLALSPPKDKAITYASPENTVSSSGWIVSVCKLCLIERYEDQC